MSLEELLKHPEGSLAWTDQRKKLVRVVMGISIMVLALILGAFVIASIKKSGSKAATARSEDVENLTQLMRIQKEAKELQAEVSELRRAASTRAAGPRRQTQGVLGRTGTPHDPLINFDPGEGFVAVKAPGEELYIPTGAVFQARLITPIKTSLEKSFVMAETTNEFRMDMKRRIPHGSRLIGRSRLNPVLKGVIVEFETLVLPTGIETSLSGLALSRNALPEIDGLYFSDHLQTYGTALAFGFLSGFADAGRVRERSFFGSIPEDTLNNQILGGLSTASFQVAEEILRDIRSRAVEYVVVPAGEPVFVALTRRYNVSQGDSK